MRLVTASSSDVICIRCSANSRHTPLFITSTHYYRAVRLLVQSWVAYPIFFTLQQHLRQCHQFLRSIVNTFCYGEFSAAQIGPPKSRSPEATIFFALYRKHFKHSLKVLTVFGIWQSESVQLDLLANPWSFHSNFYIIFCVSHLLGVMFTASVVFHWQEIINAQY